ncbi:PEP phosphonomutase [Kockovaella imperatae]|uniref:PEP phosphonomutase n=1 Tax=Kockovaella imperatae TaxID=4999 RepID=A0A1Y1URS1_9TREE|nr:PEP phosphonomutase [Kockovaella imperatae]ORX40136.1 PEP phosphonomutase [Kockovaella imperatae]
MSDKIVNSVPYPFTLPDPLPKGQPFNPSVLENSRGARPSVQASRLRELFQQGYRSRDKALTFVLSYDGLSSRLIEEAGFQAIFLGGYAMSASAGLPDAGYIAFGEVSQKIAEVARQVSIPIMVDGDTGYGSPLNVYRTVQGFAQAGAAGIMVEDQTWPKRCGHTKGKSVVPRAEAYARMQAAIDARNEGIDIVILARTDALIEGWDEAIARALKFKEMGADAIFIEALPDRAAMQKANEIVKAPMMANIIQGALTENLSGKDLAGIGFAAIAYATTLVAAQLKSVREALEDLKKAMPVGPAPVIESFDVICQGVGFGKYWEMEKRYAPENFQE